MKAKFLTWVLALGLLASGAPVIFAHAQRGQGDAQQGQGRGRGPQINKAEEDAYKAINDPKDQDPPKQIQLCEDFAIKFPMSRYLSRIYTRLISAYLSTGQNDKMFATGDKALQLDQDNVAVLSILAMAIPRSPGSNSLDAAQQYDKAEAYAKHAIELIATLPKPDDLDDAGFQKAKNDQLSMAHSGLGLVDYQRKKYPDAVTELTQAVQLSDKPDPVDYYILGNADVQTSHFKDAAAAYDKCSTFGALATRCKTNEADAQKKAATELSAPSN